VVTPPLNSGCLPGVTRELLVEAVRAPGISVVERPLSLNDLESADGLFITSSTRDLLGVREVEGLSIRREERVRTVLAQAFTAWETTYVRNAARRARAGSASA
jgi:branched-chain amino acid aminotransferase